MEPLILTRKQQRAKDIREAIREYNTFRDPWGPEHRAHAVYQGVLRNNERREYFDLEDEQGRCCCCRCTSFGWFLLLVVACGAVWYTWARIAASGHNLTVNFPVLERPCNDSVEAGSFLQTVSCTLIQSGLFMEKLAQVLQTSYEN